MADLSAAKDAAGAQVISGSGNVQIRDVVGSHIEVTIPGQKRLVPLQPALIPVGASVRSPALLVRARSGIVPFSARTKLADELGVWLDGDAAFSAAVVGGRGGSGKTHLAVELCQRARKGGWPLSGLLTRIADQGTLEALVQADLRRLVVVDYAETRAEQLEFLLPLLAAGAREEAPVRVLMLIRASPTGASDWAGRLRGRSDWLDVLLEECKTLTLENAPLNSQEREQLFTRAAEAFARRDQLPLPQSGRSRVTMLDDHAFASPLMVVIAAYLEVHGQQAPASRDALLDGILEHEARYWHSTGDGLFKANGTLPRYVASLATLVSAETQAEAIGYLRLLPQLADANAERLHEIAEWTRALYPGTGWWNPLEPDPIGEHLIATTLQNEPDIIAATLARSEPEQITLPLTVLARAAANHQAFRDTLGPVLSASLRHLCEIAVTQASSTTVRELIYGEAATAAKAIEDAITAISVAPDALRVPEGLMPSHANLILSKLAVSLTTQRVEHLQQLAEANPAAYEPDLAMSLNNLSVRLSDAGQREQALDAIQRAVEIDQRLAEANPAAQEPHLAMALSNLSNCLSDAGQREQALGPIQRAVEIRQRLAEANPAAQEPDLAMSLNNLSVRLSDAGQREQALGPIQRAVEIYQRLAEANPAAHEPDLAISLNNLSSRLSGAGQREQALDAIQRAVEIDQRLAEANPAAYEPDLAISLNNLSSRLSDADQREQALDAIQRAVEIRQQLAEANPAAYEPDLAMSLNDLSSRLSDADQREQALDAIQRAVEIYQRLAAASPAMFASKLEQTSNRLSALSQ